MKPAEKRSGIDAEVRGIGGVEFARVRLVGKGAQIIVLHSRQDRMVDARLELDVLEREAAGEAGVLQLFADGERHGGWEGRGEGMARVPVEAPYLKAGLLMNAIHASSKAAGES